MHKRLVIIGLGLLVLAGCSGVSATQVGQTAGTIAGSAIAPGIGSTLGALVGTLAGLVIDQQVDKVREQKERVELGHQLGSPSDQARANEPPVGQPTRVWVDEQVSGGRVLAGRFEVQYLP